MLFLGLVLALLSVASVVVLVAYNNSGGPEQTIVLFGRDWVNVTPLAAFVAGLVIALVFALGVWIVVASGRRSKAVRAEYRAVRREARHAARERDSLARQLERERAATAAEPAAPPTPAPAGQRQPITNVEPEAQPGTGIGRHFRRQSHPEQTPADK